MRALSNAVLAAIEADAVYLVHFFDFEFAGGTVRVSTAPTDLVLNGFTYTGIGGALRMESGVAETPDLSGGGIDLVMSGVDQSIISILLQETFVGRSVVVRAVYYPIAPNLLWNSSLETDTTGWTPNLLTSPSRISSLVPPDGLYSYAATLQNVVDSGVMLNPPATKIPVRPGGTYYAAMSCFCPTGPAQMKLFVNWYDVALASLGASPTLDFDVSQPDKWKRVEHFMVAPSNAVWASLWCRTRAASGTPSFRWDAVMFAHSAIPVPHVRTDGEAWTEAQVVAFSGYMNGAWEISETREDGRSGTVDLRARVLGPAESLRLPGGIMTSVESHRRFYPGGSWLGLGDRFFEFVPSLVGKKIEWGVPKKYESDGGYKYYTGRRR